MKVKDPGIDDPVITWPSAWKEDLPDWIFGEIKIQRVIASLSGIETATDVEALAYLYPRSHDAPLDHDWAEIYFYLGTQVMGEKLPQVVKVESLSNYQLTLLNGLKRSIYTARVKARKEKRRNGRPGENRQRVIPALD